MYMYVCLQYICVYTQTREHKVQFQLINWVEMYALIVVTHSNFCHIIKYFIMQGTILVELINHQNLASFF